MKDILCEFQSQKLPMWLKMEPIYQYKLPLPAEQWNVDPKMMGQVSALESFYNLISNQIK